MKLKIEQWAEDTKPFDPSSYELFAESVSNYKSGSYRSAFIMIYLSFKLTIRNRILGCSYGKELEKKNPRFWEDDILKDLENDDKWEGQVNKIVIASCEHEKNKKDIGILNFRNYELAKTEYNYWKEKRNACVHSKNQIIDQSTVECFWNYLMDNLSQFYVLGGEDYLIRELLDLYKYYKYPDISNKNRITGLLCDIGTVFQNRTEDCFNSFLDGIKENRTPVNDENKDFWGAVIHCTQENVADGFVRCISSGRHKVERRKIFFELYRFFPELLGMIYAINSRFIVEDLSDWLSDFNMSGAEHPEIFWRILADALSKYDDQVNIDKIICEDTFRLIIYFSGKGNESEILNRYDVFKRYLLGVSDWYFRTDATSQHNNFSMGYNDYSNIEICFSYLKWDTECLDKLEAALSTLAESQPLRENYYSILNGRAFKDSCERIIKRNQKKIEEAAEGRSYQFINQVINDNYLA